MAQTCDLLIAAEGNVDEWLVLQSDMCHMSGVVTNEEKMREMKVTGEWRNHHTTAMLRRLCLL